MHSYNMITHARKSHTDNFFFLRGRDRFASQFSANHIPFRIAKLRFCIANCDAIPDKFIPEFVLEVLKWCCKSLLFVKQVLEYTRVKLLEEASQSLVGKSQESWKYEAPWTLRNAIHKSKGVTYSLQKFITPTCHTRESSNTG